MGAAARLAHVIADRNLNVLQAARVALQSPAAPRRVFARKNQCAAYR